MFKPKWKKQAEALIKAAQKFVNYKRDLLSDDRIDEIASRQRDLKDAIKAKNIEQVKQASTQLENACEKSLPRQRPQGAVAENLEVFFVALVIALGIRTYIVQPFQIPTGSMQPTLNGITATVTDEDKPWIGKRVVDKVLRGRSHVDLVAEKDMVLKGIEDGSFLFFSRSKLVFQDGTKMTIPAPVGEVRTIPTIKRILQTPIGQRVGNQIKISGYRVEAGQTIFRGTTDNGDLVLVDKISYHFRKPNRGEVFVFDTINLDTGSKEDLKKQHSIQEIQHILDQADGSHYIKRCVGVPGDTLSIKEPHLYVNGKIASEKGPQKVMAQEGLYGAGDHRGYEYGNQQETQGTSGRRISLPPPLLENANDSLKLKKPDEVGLREFAALGDNSANSLDSRYWGPVKGYNLIGPGLFTLWPFTQGHWGLIK